MNIQYYWLLKNRIVCRDVPPYSTVADLEAADLPLQEYFDSSPHDTVHLIIDASKIVEMPNAFLLSKQGWLRHPKLGWILAFGNKRPENEARGAVAAKAVAQRIRHFETLQEALKYLQKMDQTLPDLSFLYSDAAT